LVCSSVGIGIKQKPPEKAERMVHKERGALIPEWKRAPEMFLSMFEKYRWLDFIYALRRRVIRPVGDDFFKVVLPGDGEHFFLRAVNSVTQHARIA